MDGREAGLRDAGSTARGLKINKDTLYRMARAGVIPYYKVGARKGGVRFDLEEVRHALRTQRRSDKASG